MATLFEFLDEYKSTDGQWTHTSVNPNGKYNIPLDKMTTFYSLYSKHTGFKFITEKHKAHVSPVLIDLDFKFAQLQTPRVIRGKVIDNIITFLTNILRNIYGKKEDYMCVVSQRPQQYEKENKTLGKYYSDGLHIIFPYIICPYNILHALRRKFIREYELKLGQINTIDNVYDEGVIQKNAWMLYKSTKPNMKPYEIVKIYNSEIELDDKTTLGWTKTLSIRSGVNVDSQLMPVNIDDIKQYIHDDVKDLVKYGKYENKHNEVKETKKNQADAKITYDSNIVNELLVMLNEERVQSYHDWIQIGMILYYCHMTDKNNNIDFFDIWDEWSKDGDSYSKQACVKQWSYFKLLKENNLTLGSLYYLAKKDNPEKYRNLRIRNFVKSHKNDLPIKSFSIKKIMNSQIGIIVSLETKMYCCFAKEKHDKDDMFLCINKNGMCLRCKECRFNQYPEGELIRLPETHLNYIFNITSQEEKIGEEDEIVKHVYKEYPYYTIVFPNDRKLNDHMYVSLCGDSRFIANVIYYLYKDFFRCAKYKTITQKAVYVWYEYDVNIWKENEDSKVHSLVSTKLRETYSIMLTFYEKNNNDKHVGTIKQIKKVMSKIADYDSRIKILKDAQLVFYENDKNFGQLLDTNYYLLAFTNGTYDLKEKKFRQGYKDDYLTIRNSYDYVPTHTKYMESLEQFLEDIMPIKEDRSYLLKFLASCLSGQIREEIILVCSGKTRNGKTKLKDLIALTLGPYFHSYAATLLTSKRPAPNVATPEIMELRGKRLVIGSEPPADEKINDEVLKLLTGQEVLTGRKLNQGLVEFEPTHKIALLCNTIPQFMNPGDQAIWKRLKVLKFPTTFVDEPTKPDEKKIDIGLKEKLKFWKQDLMLLLIEYYYIYLDKGLKDTKSISENTSQFLTDTNIYKQFINEATVPSTENIKTETLYHEFKIWHGRNNPKKPVPSKMTFMENAKHLLVYSKNIRVYDPYTKKKLPNSTSGFEKITLKIEDQEHKENEITNPKQLVSDDDTSSESSDNEESSNDDE